MRRSFYPPVLFYALGLLEVTGLWVGYPLLTQIVKPLLIPCLLWWVWQTQLAKGSAAGKALQVALVFSWLGDILLQFQKAIPWGFMAGLVAFLLAHVSYITTFRIFQKNGKGKWYWLAGILYVYAGWMISLLWNGAAALRIPITFYGIILATMGFMAFQGSVQMLRENRLLLRIGALLFILSDSLLALDKFWHPLPNAGFWIMLSYIGAQLFLVRASLRHLEQTKA